MENQQHNSRPTRFSAPTTEMPRLLPYAGTNSRPTNSQYRFFAPTMVMLPFLPYTGANSRPTNTQYRFFAPRMVMPCFRPHGSNNSRPTSSQYGFSTPPMRMPCLLPHEGANSRPSGSQSRFSAPTMVMPLSLPRTNISFVAQTPMKAPEVVTLDDHESDTPSESTHAGNNASNKRPRTSEISSVEILDDGKSDAPSESTLAGNNAHYKRPRISKISSTSKGKEVSVNANIVPSTKKLDNYGKESSKELNLCQYSSKHNYSTAATTTAAAASGSKPAPGASAELHLASEEAERRRAASVSASKMKYYHSAEDEEEERGSKISREKQVSVDANTVPSTTNYEKEALTEPTLSHCDSAAGNTTTSGDKAAELPLASKMNEDEEEERHNGVSTKLKLHEDPWKTKKTLNGREYEDILISLSQVLSKVEKKDISPSRREEIFKAFQNNCARYAVLDVDTKSMHVASVFKDSPTSTDSYILMDNWKQNFVERRNLKEGDTIGFYWDDDHSRFNFAVLKRAESVL